MKRENERTSIKLTLLVDLISLIAAFYLAAYLRQGIISKNFILGMYGNALAVLVLSLFANSTFDNKNRNIFKRGYFAELVSICKDQLKMYLFLLAYMFLTQQSGLYSRFFFGVLFLLNILITYVARSYLKLISYCSDPSQ